MFPPMASGCTLQWALTLSLYDYKLKHRKRANQGNCAELS